MMQELLSFISTTAVGHFEYRAVIMIVVGLVEFVVMYVFMIRILRQ